jgi:hypothetical protein
MKTRFFLFVVRLLGVVVMCGGIASLFPNTRAVLADDSRNSPPHVAPR